MFDLLASEARRAAFFKAFRIVLLLTVFIIVDILVYRYVSEIRSSNGFLNTEIVKVYAPRPGYLQIPNLEVGNQFKAGELMGNVSENFISEHALALGDSPLGRQMPLISPMDGTILSIYHYTGEHIQPEQRVMDLVNCKSVWVDTFVNEKEVKNIDTQKLATIHLLGAGFDAELKGKVQFIRFGADQIISTRTPKTILDFATAKDETQSTVMKLKPYDNATPKMAMVRLTLLSPLPQLAGNFCAVGSKVETIFQRK